MNQTLASQTKQWISLIQFRQFQQVNKELQSYRFKDTDEGKSKSLMKVLVYLCQTAIEIINADPRNGTDISELCLTVCKNFTSISHTGNFFSSLYHIIRVLLEAKRFNDAMNICNYLLPSSVYYKQMNRENLNDVYSKMWSIFFCSIDKYVKSIIPGPLTKPHFQQLLSVFKYQLTIEQLSEADGSKGLLLKLLHYREQLDQINCTPQQIEEFNEKLCFEFLSSIDLHLGDRNRLLTYQFFTKLFNKCTKDCIINGDFHKITQIMNKFIPNFDSCMAEDEEVLECYQYHREFCRIFLRPFNEFTSREVADMKSLIEQFPKHVKLNGEQGAMQYNVTSLSVLLEAVMSYWMYAAAQGEAPSDETLALNVIINGADVLNYYSNIFANFKLEWSCNCKSKNCSVYEDKQRAAHSKFQAITLLQRLSSKTNLSRELFEKYMAINSECVDLLNHLRNSDCNRWHSIWSNLGVSVYNFAIGLNNNYKESEKLYSFLCRNIIRLRAMEPEYSLFKNNPTPQLSIVLHRLSSLHYTNKNYEEAEAYTAINVFLYPTQPEGKGYRNWSYVKYQNPLSKQSLIDYYKTNSRLLKDLNLEISLSEKTMIDICLNEIQSHVDVKLELYTAIIAVLNSLEALKPTSIDYAIAVNQLGFYCIYCSPHPQINEFVRSAIKQLNITKVKSENYNFVQVLTVNLNFFQLLNKIRSLGETTIAEMQSFRGKFVTTVSSDSLNNKETNVIHSFTEIDISTAIKIASDLEEIHRLWNSWVIQSTSIDKLNFSYFTWILKLTIIAGELSKFYRYKTLEIKFWTLAYNIATRIEDYRYVVYVTGRSLMSRHVRNDWIEYSKTVIETHLKRSKNTEALVTIAMFKMSLADYYYCTGRIAEADELFEEANNSGAELDIGTNPATYMLSLYLVLTYRLPNCSLDNKNGQYTAIMARILYTMLSLDDLISASKNLEKNLYNMDMLLSVTCHVAIRMNSLYSYREITAHLIRRFDICNSRVSVLRSAEILKCFCTIDLSKNQLEDCEVKLQGLEHLLQIEVNNITQSYGETCHLKTKSQLACPMTLSPERALTDPIRDVPQNDTSPILRRERFAPPEFLTHNKSCKCFKCTNETYNFLVFSSTHIRAQLYHLQNLKTYAREHFEGAWMIRKSIMNFAEKERNQVHGYIIDYLLFLLDYVRFLKKNSSRYQEDKKYLFEALYLCELYELQSHPIFLSAMEIVFEDRFEAVFPEGFPVSDLTIPRPEDIDLSNYTEIKLDSSDYICITPAKGADRSPCPKKNSPVRHINLPPPISWSNATADIAQDEDDGLSPVVTMPEIHKKRQIVKVKPVRRKLLEDADFLEEDQEVSTLSRKSKTTSEGVKELKHSKVTLKHLIDETLSIVGGSTRKLHALRKKATNATAVSSEELQKLLAILEDIKVDCEQPKSKSRSQRNLDFEASSINLKKVDDMTKKINTLLEIENTVAASKVSFPSLNSTSPSTSSRENMENSSLNSLAKEIKKMSINPVDSRAPETINASAKISRVKTKVAKGTGIIPVIAVSEIVTECSNGVNNSDNANVGVSILQPRRSRRLASSGKRSATETKPTFNRL